MVEKVTLSDQKPKRLITDGETITNFANLLKTVVRVNEERVQAIQKVAKLQDYLLTKNGEKLDEYYDSAETKDSRMSPIDVSEAKCIDKGNRTSKHNYPIRKESSGVDKTDDFSVDEQTNKLSNPQDSLGNNKAGKRQLCARSSCCACREAKNNCLNACEDTFKDVCKIYICGRRVRAWYRHYCRRSCKIYF